MADFHPDRSPAACLGWTLEPLVCCPRVPPRDREQVRQLIFASEELQRLRRQVKQNSAVYLHHQVYVALLELLTGPELRPGDELPAATRLAIFLHLGASTVRPALRRLAREGRVETRGRGFVVAAGPATPGGNRDLSS